jgi:prepilin-type N-terminal cleavage/methylation domain-containing protein
MKKLKRQWSVVSGQRSENKKKSTTKHLSLNTGFTLTELLVVVAIMGMLAGILMPTLNVARERARRAVCAGSLKVIGEAFNMYNIDRGGMPSTSDAFSGIDTATNQIGKAGTPIIPIGLGYFYNKYIEDFAVFVCPSSSSNNLRDPQFLKREWTAENDTFSAYIYRSGSGGNTELMLADSKPAIVMDYNVRGAGSNYNHKGEYANILFKNGNVKGVENKLYNGTPDKDGQLTLNGAALDKDDLFRHMSGTLVDGGADYYQ